MIVASQPADASPDEDALRFHVALVARVLSGAAPVPPRWLVPGFVAQVEQIRRQLGPIRTGEALAASYGREARRMGLRGTPLGPHGAVAATGPLELAYALRLLELDGGAAAPWTTLVRHAAEARFAGREARTAAGRPED
ncbi:MAG TPA: hypothetical protein VN800_01950 [Candidatus Acidoferrales bacterium]|nr:hypothetical protein [Candidatus Acidoferrales bacterium]